MNKTGHIQKVFQHTMDIERIRLDIQKADFGQNIDHLQQELKAKENQLHSFIYSLFLSKDRKEKNKRLLSWFFIFIGKLRKT